MTTPKDSTGCSEVRICAGEALGAAHVQFSYLEMLVGMLASEDTIATVAKALADHKVHTVVVDPVSLPCLSVDI